MAFITTAIAGAFALGTFGTLVVSTLVGLALSYGVSLLTSKYLGREKARSYSAVQGEIQVGGAIGIQAGFGIVATKGYRSYYAAFGSGNAYNTEVFVLSSGRCGGLESYVWLGGEKKNLINLAIIGGEHAHYGIEGYEGLFSIRFYDGRVGQIADAKLVADTVNLGNNWKSTSTGDNLCYLVVERRYSAVFENRRPDILWILRGLRCYDPRLDDTFSGGVGPHRLADAATWEFTQNPAIQRLNYQIGFRGLASSVTLIGMGKQLSHLDTGSYIASANVCDTQRIVGGESIDTYHCNLIAFSSDDHSQVLKEFDDAMAGYGLNRSGLSGVLAGAPQIATRTLTDDDIRIDAPSSSQPRRSGFDQVNYLSGQYTSLETMFQPESLDPLTSASDVALDGRLRTKTNDILQVLDPRIAQYILTIRYRQNRFGARETKPVSARFWFHTELGEWINYAGKVWLVTNKDRGNLVLAETSSTIFAEGGISAGPIVTVPVKPINPSLITTVANFEATSGSLGSLDTSIRPALKFTWDAPDDPSVISVRIEYRRIDDTTVFTATTQDVELGELVTTNNVMPGSTYECRATIETTPDRFKTWTGYETTAIPTVDQTVFLRQVQEDIREPLIHAREQIDILRDTNIIDAVQASTLDTGNSYLQRRSVQKSVNNAVAKVIQEALARVEGDEALASSLVSVQASVDDATASGLFKVVATAAPTGVDARLALFIRATIGDAFKEAGIFLDANLDINGGSSSITMVADKFSFSDGPDTVAPFVIQDDELTFNGVIRSADNKFRIEADNSRIVISD